MHGSSKARNTGHVHPDCRNSVDCLSVTLKSECTRKEKILITFLNSSSVLRSRKLNFYAAIYSFHENKGVSNFPTSHISVSNRVRPGYEIRHKITLKVYDNKKSIILISPNANLS